MPDQILVDLLRAEPYFDTSRAYYISVYHKSSRYGGSEEGGWWKDYLTHVGSIRFPDQQTAERNLERITEKANERRILARRATVHQTLNSVENPMDHDDSFLNHGDVMCDDAYLVTIEMLRGSLDNSTEPIGTWD